jgi:hypothetical protein
VSFCAAALALAGCALDNQGLYAHGEGGGRTGGSTATLPDGGTGGQAPAPTPTYYRDVKPLVEVKCTGCHAAAGIAPFALETYDELVAQLPGVKAAVLAGTMPPWPPAKGCAGYLGDRSLTEPELQTLTSWIDAGAPAGDPQAQPVSVPDTRTKLSRVDLTLTMPTAYTPQVSPDDYRCFLVDWPATDTRYVTGLGVTPGDPAQVHHVIAFLARPSAVAGFQTLDAASPGPGWQCFGGPGQQTGTSWVGAWAPGALGADYPEGTGIEIPPGSKIVIQVHYNTASSAPAPDQTSLVLKLDSTVEKKAAILPWADVAWVLQGQMDIPAGATDAVVTYAADPTPFMGYLAKGAIAANQPFTIHSVGLHMHTHGARARTSITRAGGAGDECLLDIPSWDFHWQGSYGLAAPARFHPGDALALECHFDNPGATDLHWGEGTADEMCLGVFYATE